MVVDNNIVEIPRMPASQFTLEWYMYKDTTSKNIHFLIDTMDCNGLADLDHPTTFFVEERGYTEVARDANRISNPIQYRDCVSTGGLMTMELTGNRTCCISIKRYMTLQQVRREDPTFSFTKAALWAMIECTTTICCAALPGSTYALKRMLPLDLMKRAISWVEHKCDTFEPSRLQCRKPRADDTEANSAVLDQRNNREPLNNLTNQVE